MIFEAINVINVKSQPLRWGNHNTSEPERRPRRPMSKGMNIPLKLMIFISLSWSWNHVLKSNRPGGGSYTEQADGGRPAHTGWAHTGRMEGKQSSKNSASLLSACHSDQNASFPLRREKTSVTWETNSWLFHPPEKWEANIRFKFFTKIKQTWWTLPWIAILYCWRNNRKSLKPLLM